MFRFVTVVILSALLWSGLAKAEVYPPYMDAFVSDLAGALDPAAENGLRTMLETLEAETGVEMTVLTIRTRDDYAPSASIEAFATGLFNDWGIGRADRNDGILVLVAVADREMRIALGSAYGQGYDVLAQDIISRFFLPDFRDGDYQRGIVAGTGETIARIARRHALDLPPEALQKAAPGGIPGWVPVLALAAFGGLIAVRRRIGDALQVLRRCPACGRLGMRRGREVVASATAEDDGPGVVRTRCRHCDFHEDRPYAIPRKTASGRRGSFGGGRSSGGGATGRW
ncbi:TPM domain-containing protein [Defluviimonas sp. SAOS-178_SWC]|uniref:TPM domain-containing protein n=1 Tax=Defluviimonas sp. SAOS-178_SWC TaxID=3121287 RepID=UPI003221552C